MRNNTCKIYTHKTAIISTLILISLLPSSAINAWTLFPRTVFEAAPFEGKIVDAETGQPIPNAVVFVRWPRMTSTFGGSNPNGAVDVQEALSDTSGHYKMAGWKKSKKEAGKGWFSKSRPEMVVYASGYWPESRHNQIRSDDKLARNEVWKSEWDGKTIELKPMHSEEWDYGQWREYLSTTKSYMSVYFMPECPWLKIPNYYLARHRAVTKAYRMGVNYGQSTRVHTVLYGFLTKYRSTLEKDCGVDPKAFFLSNGMSKEEFDECCSGQPRPIRLEPVFTFPAEPEAGNSSGVEK